MQLILFYEKAYHQKQLPFSSSSKILIKNKQKSVILLMSSVDTTTIVSKGGVPTPGIGAIEGSFSHTIFL